MSDWMRWAKFVLAAGLLCVSTAMAPAAGLQLFDVPTDAGELGLAAAVWYPCTARVTDVRIGNVPVKAAKDCPVAGAGLPLVVVSHGYSGKLTSHHDTAETLANAGFVVAAINHPIDSGPDMSRADTVAMLAERPRDIKRLVDYMLDRWPDRARLDPDNIGFFGFSRGGYTGLVLVGANPDLPAGLVLCGPIPAAPACQQIHANTDLPTSFTHDPRIKAAVIADPGFGPMFTRASLRDVSVPIQLWASRWSGEDPSIGVRPEYIEAIRDNLPGKPDFHFVENAGHYAFLVPCPPTLATMLAQLCDDHAGFDRVAFHQQFDAAVLAFFQQHLMSHP